MSFPLYFKLGFLFGITSLGAQEVSLPSKRMEALDMARELLTPHPVVESAEQIEQANPFYNYKNIPTSSGPVLNENQVSDRDLLFNLSKTIVATGTMQVRGKSILLIGQKNLKMGDSIPILFQGVTYELKIISIERTTFTISLNGEEITRPIKPN